MKPTPPLRLHDDPRSPASLREGLARAADPRTTPFDAVQGLAAFEAALGKVGPAAPPSPQAAAAGTTSTLAGAIVKGVIGGLLMVGAAGQLSNLRGRHDAARVSTVMASAAPLFSSQAPQASPVDAPVDASPTPPPPAPPAATHPPVRLAAPPAPVAGASDLQLETELLGRLRALEPSDPQQALALAEEGRRRFSPGFFGQEREVLAISALARLGRRSEARARAHAFLAANPRSHFVERLRELTGD